MKTVFVSSTFKDMHYERDVIRDITAPLLNEEARKYHDEIDFCDLRWGIDTGYLDSEEGSKKVLEVCLDEIDRCKPPMVVMLGYRYGWIPNASLIKNEAERKHLELDDLERSVTALEIEYGALCDRQKLDNTLFYFREIEGNVPADYLSEDAEHEKKIIELKDRIKAITGGKVKYYTLKWNGTAFEGVELFAKLLAEDIKTIMLPKWKKMENMTAFERERRAHSLFIRAKNAMFRARQAEAGELIQKAISQPITIIKGKVGEGKSTLFSYIVTEMKKTEWEVLPFISGLTMDSNTAMDIIKNTVYFIEEKLERNHYIDEIDPKTGEKVIHSTEDWRNRLAKICHEYTESGKKLIIMVDAIEQLLSDEVRNSLYLIPTSVSESLHFLMTCVEEFKTQGKEYTLLRKLNDEDKCQVIEGILARSGRELSENVKTEMIAQKASDNPLYLSLVVQRLLLMNSQDFEDIQSNGDGISAIEKQQIRIIKKHCSYELEDMCVVLLEEAGKRINQKLIVKVAEYLAVSRNGLRKKDLAVLTGEEWKEIDFVHFISYMSDCFMQRDDGRYDFTHKSIRAGFVKRCADVNKRNRQVLAYMKALEEEDEVKAREVVYHTIKADDKRYFVEYVKKIIFKHKLNELRENCAARDIYEHSILDGGKWICDVLKEAESYEIDENSKFLATFMGMYLSKTIENNLIQLEIVKKIFETTILYSECIYNRESDYNESVQKGREPYEKLKVEKTCKAALFGVYRETGRIYEMLSKIYINSGKKEDLKKAAGLYIRIQGVFEKIAKLWGKNLNQEEAIWSFYRKEGGFYGRAGEIYESLNGEENLRRAAGQYVKELKLRKSICTNIGTQESKRDLWKIYMKVAATYERLNGREYLSRALTVGKRGIILAEELRNSSDTLQSKIDLKNSYYNLAKIYSDIQKIQTAKDYYEKCVSIVTELTKNNSEKYVNDLDTVLFELRKIQIEISKNEQREKILRHTMKSQREVIDRFQKFLNIHNFYDSYVNDCEELADILCKLNRLNEAEQYYIEAIKFTTQFQTTGKEQKIAESVKLYNKLGNISGAYYFKKAVNICLEQLQRNPRWHEHKLLLAETYRNYANYELNVLNDIESAKGYFAKVIDIYQCYLGYADEADLLEEFVNHLTYVG